MAINKSFGNTKTPVMWNGEEALSVRGLTPDDITKVLILEGENIADLFGTATAVDLSGVNTRDTEQLADWLMAKAPTLLMALANKSPTLLARILAVSAMEGEDDLEESAEYIRSNFTLPLQFEAAVRIAALTFAGPEGFRLFVGNVMALVETVAALTSVKTKPMITRPVSAIG